MAAAAPSDDQRELNLLGLSVKELKKYISDRDGSAEDCVEKSDLLARALEVDLLATTGGDGAAEGGLLWDVVQVRDALFSLLRSREARAWDDGSFAPLFIRLAWHCCGTYDATSNTGGSNGGTLRFEAEQNDPENAGLGRARELLEPIYEQFSGQGLTHADLWVLAGYVSLEFAGGPRIPFRRGRIDFSPEEAEQRFGANLCPFGDGAVVTGKDTCNPCGSRLPAADLGEKPGSSTETPPTVSEAATINHVRATFARMGFNDRETVALIILGHQFGRGHPDVSGYEHPWYGFAPTEWNVYEYGLGYLSALSMGESFFQETTSSGGKRQWQAQMQGRYFMMLPSDMTMKWDPSFYKHLREFDRDRRGFIKESAAAWIKLTELGCDTLYAV